MQHLLAVIVGEWASERAGFEEAGASGVCFVGRPSAVRNPLSGYDRTASLDEIDRVLRRKFDAGFYERQALSRDK
jgi:hypothetical protein